MEVLKFNIEINDFTLTINFIWHLCEYSLMSFLNQSAIYPNIDLPYF